MLDLTRVVFQRRALLEAHILQHLRQRLEKMRRLGGGLSFLGQHRQHLQRRDQPVAGGGEVRQDDMAGLFAADIEAALGHFFQHIAVAHRGARQLTAPAS